VKTRLRPVSLVLAVLVLAGAMLGLAACGGAPENVDPTTVLNAASVKMKEINGFHFVYQVHKPESSPMREGAEILKIEGDINTDGNMQATIQLLGGGVLINVDFVAVGDTHYIRYPLTTKWQAIPAAESPVGTVNLSSGTIRILDQIYDTTYQGSDKKGGAKTYHIKGTVAAVDVEAIAGSTNTDQPFPTELWVGTTDNLLYEVDIFGAATPDETDGYWRSIVLSNQDEAVEIKAPQ
jgi:hypothetical protein